MKGGYMRSSNKWALRFGFLAFFIATLLLSPDSGRAQLSTGSVTGIVRDSKGSVVANASVTLHNFDTTVQHKTVSNDSGNYVFLNLGPGRNPTEAKAPGSVTNHLAD